MSLSSVVAREAGAAPHEKHRAALAAIEVGSAADAREFFRHATAPDVLDLLLLHGDCAFLLDLRELIRA
jgi:hypothetical protein